MKQDKTISEDLNKIAPTLAAINKENSPFKVPENYFTTLPERIRQKTIDTKRVNKSLLEWFDFYLHKPAFLFTTLLLLAVFIASVFFFNSLKIFNTEDEIKQFVFSGEELNSYITCNLHNYYVEEIIESYGDMNNINFEVPGNLLNTEIESYIINNINENLIMEELL